MRCGRSYSAGDLLDRVRFYAGVALGRNKRMADHVRALPGCVLSDAAHCQISLGGGLELATELAVELAAIEGVDALHSSPSAARRASARSLWPTAPNAHRSSRR